MESIILITEVVEKILLLLMFALSIWSISIILERRKVFKQEHLQDSSMLREKIQNRDWAAVRQWAEAHSGFVAGAMLELFKTKQSQAVDRSISSYVKMRRSEFEKGFAVLATLGANAPFIGLFGTVLGIIRAFSHLGGQAAASQVMSGVSQALYATAIGLLVAIPAVIAFNYFTKKMRDLILQVESLRDLYLAQDSVD